MTHTEIGRLPAGQDHLNDARRQEGERQHAADIRGMDTKAFCNILATKSLSICQLFETGMGSGNHLDQRPIGARQECLLPFDHQPSLDTAPADGQR